MRRTRSATGDMHRTKRIVPAAAAVLTASVILIGALALLHGGVAAAAPAAHATLAGGVASAGTQVQVHASDARAVQSASPRAALLQPYNTSTTITSDEPDPSAPGQDVVVKVQVTASGTSASPTGSVNVSSGAVSCTIASLSASGPSTSIGQCTLTFPTTTTKGNKILQADYSPTGSFIASSDTEPHTVNKAKTWTTLDVTPLSSTFGQTITLHAHVTSTFTVSPTGYVYFNDGGVTIGTAPLDLDGDATLMTFALEAGSHSLTAVYDGDENHVPSTSADTTGAIFYQVAKRGTATAATLLNAAPVFGETLTFNISVTVVTPPPFATEAGTPSGYVTISEAGLGILGTAELDGSGNAAFVTDQLDVGSYTLTFTYGGDPNFASSASGGVAVTVARANTTIGIVSAVPSSSVYGQAVTFTAHVTPTAPAMGIPTGEVEFRVNGTPMFTGVLGFGTPGEVTWTTPPGDATPLPVGTHSITAHYLGDVHFNASNSSALSYSVSKASTTIDLQDPLPDPTDFGQPVQLSAIVQVQPPGAGTPSGTVQFKIYNPTVLTVNVSLPAGSTSATTTTTAIAQGTRNITAQYLGDSNFLASAIDTESHTVNKTQSRTTLSSTPNPSVYGEDITLTAVIEPAGSSVAVPAAPSGSVDFYADDGSGPILLGTDSSLVQGTEVATATFSASSYSLWPLDAGSYTFTAEFQEDANFQASSDSSPQTINQVGTATALTSDAPGNTSQVGDPVTFTATVTSTTGVTPTGTVTFRRNGSPIATCTNLSLDTNGQATCTLTSLPEGTANFQAAYNGTTNFTASTSSTIAHTVTAQGSTTTLTSSAASAAYGANVTFTATVTDSTTTNPITSGQVVFQDGVTTLATVPLDGTGTAVFNTSSLVTPLSVGSHTIRATFPGTSVYAGSYDEVTLNVTQVTSSITLSSSANPSVYGQQVVFTAVVAPTSGTGTPTGQVTFTLPSPVGVVVRNLSGGTASLAVNNLNAGAHAVQAEYGGDTNFSGAGPASLVPDQTVNPVGTQTTVTTSPNPSVVGQSVTFQATVVVNAGVPTPGAGPPPGSVQFSVNSVNVGSAVPLASGTASYTYVGGFSSTGSYNVGAAYTEGAVSPNYQDSSGSTAHTVGDAPADLSVTKADSPDPVNAGDNLTYNISVTNPGAGQNVVLTDTLPSQVTFQQLTPGSWNCTTVPAVGSTGQIVCNRTSMPAATEALTVIVNVPAATPAGVVLRNRVDVRGDLPDGNLGNNTFVQETTVYRSPRLLGDCNADNQLSVTDIYAIVDDIFDPAYRGPAVCDANADTKVDAGDVPCTALLIAEGACSAATAAQAATQAGQAKLEAPAQLPALPGTRMPVPLLLTTNGNRLSSLVFSVDYDETWLSFDPLDANADGIPDAITFVLPADYEARVAFDADDTDGEIDIFLADTIAPLVALSDGPLAFIRLDVERNPTSAGSGVHFSASPRGSFGNTEGWSAPGVFEPMRRLYRYLPLIGR